MLLEIGIYKTVAFKHGFHQHFMRNANSVGTQVIVKYSCCECIHSMILLIKNNEMLVDYKIYSNEHCRGIQTEMVRIQSGDNSYRDMKRKRHYTPGILV